MGPPLCIRPQSSGSSCSSNPTPSLSEYLLFIVPQLGGLIGYKQRESHKGTVQTATPVHSLRIIAFPCLLAGDSSFYNPKQGCLVS